MGSRLIHYSADRVFDGAKGEFCYEDDPCSAKDVYGLSKYLSEGGSGLDLEDFRHRA